MTARLPSTFKKLSVIQMTHKFRDAAKIVSNPIPKPGPGQVLVKNRFVGVNASDINHAAGRYDTTLTPPFDCGFEGVGEVVGIGDKVKHLKTGQAVAYINFGAFSEFCILDEKIALPLPEVKREYVPLLVSGLTAALSLQKVGDLKAGETVLVTAAAGGTGQFAVQVAKNLGCHVIGTCSTNQKVAMLKSLGCDRTINYSEESIKDVLKKEYPNGVDVVYETVGGETFDLCIDALAVKGRLISIGFIEGYETALGLPRSKKAALLPILMLRKSASIRGFFLNHFMRDWPGALQQLVQDYEAGRIRCITDAGENAPTGPFTGVDSVHDAVDYLYSKKSIGKIIVEFPDQAASKL